MRAEGGRVCQDNVEREAKGQDKQLGLFLSAHQGDRSELVQPIVDVRLAHQIDDVSRCECEGSAVGPIIHVGEVVTVSGGNVVPALCYHLHHHILDQQHRVAGFAVVRVWHCSKVGTERVSCRCGADLHCVVLLCRGLELRSPL